jgi:hypothetical protein
MLIAMIVFRILRLTTAVERLQEGQQLRTAAVEASA